MNCKTVPIPKFISIWVNCKGDLGISVSLSLSPYPDILIDLERAQAVKAEAPNIRYKIHYGYVIQLWLQLHCTSSTYGNSFIYIAVRAIIMATGIVRASISLLLEEPEFLVGTPRNIATREVAKKLLDVIIIDGNLMHSCRNWQGVLKLCFQRVQFSSVRKTVEGCQHTSTRIEKLGQLLRQELYLRLV